MGGWLPLQCPAAPRKTIGMTLFTIRVDLQGVGARTFEYESVVGALEDPGLAKVFADKLVQGCAVYCATKRITKLPHSVMLLSRLVDQLVSNSTTILREHPALQAGRG